MTAPGKDLDDVLLAERELWEDGPPYDLFARIRGKCPVHWTPSVAEYPDEPGFWSVTTAEDVRAVSRDWKTYSAELGGVTLMEFLPLELARKMFVAQDPPKHDRVRGLFNAGFTPRRIAEHEDRIRAIVVDVLEKVVDREECDLVSEVAEPVVQRVMGSFLGIPPEDDELWGDLTKALLGTGDPEVNPEGPQTLMERTMPQVVEQCLRLIAERREHPTDDLTSVLVHAELDGERLSEEDIIMGFFLLLIAGFDSSKATYCSGMQALMEHPDQRQLLLDDPSLIPSAIEETLRMFPPATHFRRTATCDTELGGKKIQAGEKVLMWYVSSNRDETRYEDPERFDVTRNPDHDAFGGGGRHFCLGNALGRLELKILFEETLRRFPAMQPTGKPDWASTMWLTNLRTLNVRLCP